MLSRILTIPVTKPTNFLSLWLRHNCRCNKCIHPMSGELLTRPHKLTEKQTIIKEVKHYGDSSVIVTWKDDHVSYFGGEFLKEYGGGEVEEGYDEWDLMQPSATPLPAPEPIEFDMDRIVERVNENGYCWIKNFGLDNKLLIKLLSDYNYPLFESHFGPYEDIQPKELNTTNKGMNDQLGYTRNEIDLHTDQPFLAYPPPLQSLHCIKKATSGGENYISDGRIAYEILEMHDYDGAMRLVENPITFDRNQKNFKKKLDKSVIEVDEDGMFKSVRSSYFNIAPFKMPELATYYRAYINYHKILDEMKLRIDLDEGDILMYDNYRMLHGRGAFVGNRLIKGTYHTKKGCEV